MRQNLRAATAVLGILGLAAAPGVQAEEGMWTFDNFPTERMQSELGWAPDQAWLDRVMAGTARLPGCSASNVSANGLVLTNHHCVISCVTALSTDASNFITYGFGARNHAEERQCPNMSMQVLQGISDVTERINVATAGAAAEGFARARDAEVARIEAECTQGAQRCEVVALYQGGRYALHRFKRFDDVRLVFAPEHGMAAFGGDTDNFNFPRYALDFSLLRLYENGRPAATPNHLNMDFSPLEEGEIVLIAGNPGGTSRARTSAELVFERDFNLPWQLASLAEIRTRVAAYAAQGQNQARIAASTLQTIGNAHTVLSGRRQALANAEAFARITAGEQDLQQRVRRNRAAQREVGDAWGEITRAQTSYRAMFYQYQYLEARAGERSLLFAWARDIVRGAAERTKPDAERMRRFTDARLANVVQGINANRPVTPEFEEIHLAFWLSQLRAQLAANDPVVRRVLGDETPEALAQRLSRSRLADPAYRRQLWEGGAAAVAASDDPMIIFVRAWDADARAVRERYVTQVEGPVARAQERIARARFRAFGLEHYPDATFSPRVSYGRVEGWMEPDGRVTPAFTRVSGLYERATGQAPFALSQRWLDARARMDANTIYNVSTSNDVIGGNSGSPLLNRDGRVVGVVFDGNVHSLGGEYFYDGALNRSVTVSSSAIRMALGDVYGMRALLSELGGE
ncbi:MAG: S46 family peptidase [Hyphomonadaceae bacterium JAD_PAG50586_4]|nr:MAG: S46 family peptidase [Hyphomonadaceae bacterium JAD_PAG50586_4]